MDNNYTGYVLCRGSLSGGKYLAMMPKFEYLTAASIVRLENISEPCTVIEYATTATGGDEDRLIRALYGSDDIPRAISRMIERRFDWPDEDDEKEAGNDE